MAGVLAVGSLGLVAAKTPAPTNGGVLRLATQSAPSSLDVAHCADPTCIQFNYLQYNTLVTYGRTSTKIVPSLATTWTMSKNREVWTFYLRHGVSFSNGDPFNAAAVAFTLTRLNEQVTAAPYQASFALIKGGPQVFAATAKADLPATKYVSGVDIVNPYEIRITLTEPTPYFLNLLALPSAGIEDPRVAESYSKDEAAGKTIDVVGTGPFVLKKPGAAPTQYQFARNPHYWVNGLPHLAGITIRIVPNAQLQLEMFQHGQLDALPPFLNDFAFGPSEYLDILKSATTHKDYISELANGVYFVFMNPNIKPFNNVYLRQAIAYALNKPLIAKLLTNGRAGVANSVLPPNMPGYDPRMNVFPVQNSPAGLAKAQSKAKALLVKAGYPNGVNVGEFAVVVAPGAQQVASLITQELAAVGIHTQAKLLQLSVWYNQAVGHKLGFSETSWYQDYPDPQDFMFNMFDSQEIGGNNWIGYSNETVDSLVQRADTLTSLPARVALYRKAETIVLRSAAFVPLYWAWQDGLVGANVYPKTPQIWAHPAQPSELDQVWIAK